VFFFFFFMGYNSFGFIDHMECPVAFSESHVHSFRIKSVKLLKKQNKKWYG